MTDFSRVKKLCAGSCAGGLLVLTSFVGQAVAEPVQLGLHLDERYSDNVGLREHDPQGDLQHRLAISVHHQTDPAPCSSMLNGVFGFKHYQRSSFSDQTDLNGSWDGVCQLSDTGLQWMASDSVNQVSVNSSQPFTPNNETRRNVFSSGPQYIWLIGPRDRVVTSAQYQRTVYSGQQQGNATHYLGSSNFSHQVSPSLSVGLGANIDKGKLDTGEDITRRTGNFQITKSFATSRFSGTVGYSQLSDNYGGFQSTDSGMTWRLRFDKQLNVGRSLYAEYGRELSDSSAPYVIQIAGLNFNLSQTSALQVTHWRAGLNQETSSGGRVGLDLAQQTSDYLRSGEVDKRSSATVSATQPIVTNLTLDAGVSLTHQTNSLSVLTQNTYGGSLSLTYRKTKALSIRAGLGRNLNSASGGGTSYRENWMLVGLDYAFR